MQRLVSDLNRTYRDTSALWSQDFDPAGFTWIDANDASGNVFSFLRFGADGSLLACVANFSAVPHEHYRLGLPRAGRWDEVINTDAERLLRLRRRQPRRRRGGRVAAGTASRPRPSCGCRRSARSGCVIRG